MMSQQTIAIFRDCTGKKDYLKELIKTKQSTQLWVNWKKNGSK